MNEELKKPRVTKAKQVEEHLRNKGHITSLEAINLYKATRLSAIIYNLRHKKDMNIKTEDVHIKDCNGNSCIFANYIYIP